MEPFHNQSPKPIFVVFVDEEDGQRVAEFNGAWARQHVECFYRLCQLARQNGIDVPAEQYAFVKHVEATI